MQENALDLINATLNVLTPALNTICFAKYGNTKNKVDHIHFMRNVLLNMVGNFLLEYTKHEIEGAIDKHVEQIEKDFSELFVKVKELSKTRNQSKGTH